MTQTNDPTDLTTEPATPTEAVEKAGEPEGGPVVAPSDKRFTVKWLIIASLLPILAGGWFLYDGFVGYPEHNRELAEMQAERDAAADAGDMGTADAISERIKEHGTEKDSLSILIQQALGFALPIFGIAMGVWTLRDARGELRLDADDTLHAPGHPSVRPGQITSIDDTRWDRKGKSFVSYDVDGQTGTLKIDDFVRQRPPTDKIHDRIVYLHKQHAAT